MRYILILTLIAFSASSCVTKKKFDELLAENVQMQNDIQDLETRLNAANKRIERLDTELEDMNKAKDLTQSDLDRTSQELATLQSEHDNLQTVYDNLLKNSGKLNRDLSEQQSRLLAMQTDLEAAQKKNEELSSNLAEREQKVEELEKILADTESAIKQLKETVSNALLNFSDNDLTVEIKDGKVYVSLAEQLLFKSGSVQVDPKGKEALRQVANALRDEEKINITVEGHTDNVPVSRTSTYMNDNWDLSVMRATVIVKILVDSGVDPQMIIASGRGEFTPVAPNDSAEGRSKNRRTEVIITPDLSELFKILEGEN
jgi:chemotaxis protein MotB